MRNLKRVGIALFLWLFSCGIAFAHPLGNFTINHLSEVHVAPGTVTVRYTLDMAEIPTYSALRERFADGRPNGGQLDAWARDRAAALAPQLLLTVDGVPARLTLTGATAHTRPGAGGLPTLYLVADLRAALPASSHAFAYDDTTYTDRLGWKDVVVAPETEPTHELTAYPGVLLGSPRNRTTVAADLGPRGQLAIHDSPLFATTETLAGVPAAPSAIRSNQLSDMLARGTSDPIVVIATLAIAIVLGALHALEPGHGKTLLAVSLVGARATVRQAGILAGSLTIAHTIGVLLLGVAIETLKGAFVPEQIYPWITLLSGVAIAVIGARAVQRQVLALQPFAHVHGHAHAGAHAHAHPHVHGVREHHHDATPVAAHAHGGEPHDHAALDDAAHARAHAIPGVAPLKFGPTVWAAMSGGIAPCPAALVVLLAAVALNEVAYGIVVIVAFSFGLAGTLTGLGIGVVRGAKFLQGRAGFDRFVKYGPLGSAIVISTIGAIMLGQGFVERGVHVSAIVVSVLAALAIAGFAFSHPPARRTVNA